jgi:hypothetical protein
VASKKVGEIIFSFFFGGKKTTKDDDVKKNVGNIKCRELFVLDFQNFLDLLLPCSKNIRRLKIS